MAARRQVVINSFPPYSQGGGAEGELTLAAHVALAIILALTFVLQMTPVFHVAEDLVHREDNSRLPPRLWPATRVALVGLVALTGAVVPNMETMVSLTGSVALSAIGFVLPGVFFLKLRPPPAPDAGLAFGSQHEVEPIVTFSLREGVPSSVRYVVLRELWDEIVAVLLIVTGVVGGGFGIAATLPTIFN